MKITIVKQKLPELEKTVLEVPASTTVGAALELARIEPREGWSVSVWNEERGLDHVLEDGDRIEICEPLRIDPKKARMLRAQAAREQKVGKRRHAAQNVAK